MNSKTDESFGVIPVYKNEEGKFEILVIHQYSHIGDNSYWVFPKGHSEKGEIETETALRELKEETDITEIDLKTEESFKMRYNFIHEGNRIDKTVTFFVGFVPHKYAKGDESEVRELVWLSPKEVRKKLTHENTKKLFDKVCKYIDG